MSYCELERKRATQKFHCPVSGTGEVCAGREECHRLGGVRQDAKRRIVRIKINVEKFRTFAALAAAPLSMEAAVQETQCTGAHQCQGRSRISVGAPLYAKT